MVNFLTPVSFSQLTVFFLVDNFHFFSGFLVDNFQYIHGVNNCKDDNQEKENRKKKDFFFSLRLYLHTLKGWEVPHMRKKIFSLTL